MNDDNMKDEKLRNLVQQTCEKRSQECADSTPSFQELWSRARIIHAQEPKKRYSVPWFTRALLPMTALATLVFVIQFSLHKVRRSQTEPLPRIAIRLELPSDSLLKMAQTSYLTAQPKLPTDSIKWRTE